jgi:hypothetical protein
MVTLNIACKHNTTLKEEIVLLTHSILANLIYFICQADAPTRPRCPQMAHPAGSYAGQELTTREVASRAHLPGPDILIFCFCKNK